MRRILMVLAVGAWVVVQGTAVVAQRPLGNNDRRPIQLGNSRPVQGGRVSVPAVSVRPAPPSGYYYAPEVGHGGAPPYTFWRAPRAGYPAGGWRPLGQPRYSFDWTNRPLGYSGGSAMPALPPPTWNRR